MNEKTKQILRYVACGLGGLALGIGLLGGLSMCATSNRSTAESVNTILTKRNAQGTTTDGSPSYSFAIGSMGAPTETNTYSYKTYTMNTATYTPTSPTANLSNHFPEGQNNLEGIQRIVQNIVRTQTPTEANVYKFLLVEGVINENATNRQFFYSTFLYKSSSNEGAPLNAFVLTNKTIRNAWRLNQDATASYQETSNLYLLKGEQSEIIPYSTNDQTEPLLENNFSYIFQDVASYYKELGYQQGYGEGEEVGYNSGYADGYEDGSDNGLLFTNLGVNQLTWASSDLSWDDSTDTTQTMKLFDFKDGENSSYYVTLTDYSLGGANAIVQVFKNGTASNNEYATIARGTWNGGYTQLEIIPSTYLKFEFAQITTYYHNSIPNGWFTLSGIPANATGYEAGYQTGYREGYLASPGGQATQNVFSLFTNAFDSVGGIFNLKIFGFLPLYWFFLTPIFIAIITLILRLVKH